MALTDFEDPVDDNGDCDEDLGVDLDFDDQS